MGQGPFSAASNAVTPVAPVNVPGNLQILAKWNLIVNSGGASLDVTTLFGTQDAPVAGASQYVLSVWK